MIVSVADHASAWAEPLDDTVAMPAVAAVSAAAHTTWRAIC